MEPEDAGKLIGEEKPKPKRKGHKKEIILLNAETIGVVEPTVRHEVKPRGKVRFYVEFYR